MRCQKVEGKTRPTLYVHQKLFLPKGEKKKQGKKKKERKKKEQAIKRKCLEGNNLQNFETIFC